MPRDPEATRRKLLDAAFVEFCAHGLAGARVDRIADAAGVNKRMLYYYFGDKDGLWKALLAEKLGAVQEVRAERPASLAEQFAYFQKAQAADRDWTRLVTWEALEGGPPWVEAKARTAAWTAVIAEVEAAQERGELPSELDAAQLELSLVALVTFPIAFPQYTKMITGRSSRDRGFLADRLEHMRQLAEILGRAAER